MYTYLGANLIELPQTTSTQDVAKDHVFRDGLDAICTAIYTEDQTAGRGRAGRTWHAPKGANVCLTVIATPVLHADLWRVTFVAAVAVAEAMAEFVPEDMLRLRFPNDVLLAGKKVSGILTEAETGALVPDGRAIPLIGIGVNVLGETSAMPPDVAVRATTIAQATGVSHTPTEVRDTILQKLSAVWDTWQHFDGFDEILTRWHAYQDQSVSRPVLLDGETVACRTLSVSGDGMVVLELPDGTRRLVPVSHILLR